MLSNAVYIQGHTFLSVKQHKSFEKKITKHRQKSGPRAKKLPRKKVLQVAQPQITRGPVQRTLSFPHTNTCLIFHQVLFYIIPTFHKLHFACFKGDERENKIIF